LDIEILVNDFGLKKEYSLELMEGIKKYLKNQVKEDESMNENESIDNDGGDDEEYVP